MDRALDMLNRGRKKRSKEFDKNDPYSAIPQAELKDLEAVSGWGRSELNDLYMNRFLPHIVRQWTPESGEPFTPEFRVADLEQLCTDPKLSVHPLIQKVMINFNEDRTGRIRFAEYARAMRALSARNTLDGKLKFAFDLYDVNRSGIIDTAEMFKMTRMMLGRAHNDHHLQGVCDRFAKNYPDGFTFEEFTKMFEVTDLNRLVLNL